MADAPVRIERQADGRHAVMDAGGAVLGIHKSPWSAARQMHDYFGGGAGPEDATGPAPVAEGDVQPARQAMEAKRVGGKQSAIMEHPKIQRPPKSRPKIPTKRIPKP